MWNQKIRNVVLCKVDNDIIVRKRQESSKRKNYVIVQYYVELIRKINDPGMVSV